MEHIKPGLRSRLVWLASPDATSTMVLAFAIVVMATSLVLTFSRSGILGLMAAAIVVAFVVIRRQSTGMRRTVAAAYVMSIVVVSLAWGGLDLIINRFAATGAGDMDRRIGAWFDAWHIFQRFPVAGTGLNTYGIATLFYQTINLTHHYDQAHNDYLQLAAEGGVLLLVPAVAALVTFCVAVRSRFAATSPQSTDYWIRIGAVAGLVAIGLQELGEFSLQMPGNAVMFCVLAAIVLRAPDPSRGASLR
jgi:O-antigen ligase